MGNGYTHIHLGEKMGKGGLRRASLVAVICGIPALTMADTTRLDTSRADFMAARAALAADDLDTFDATIAELEDYVLYDHLQMERLLHDWRISEPGKQAITDLNAFEQSSKNTSLTRRLTRQLQRRLASTNQWSLFLGLKESRLAAGMPCTTLRARDELGQLEGFDKAAIELWVQPQEHDEICADVLVELEENNTPPIPAIWERIYLSMSEGKPAYAEEMLKYLGSRDRKPVVAWIEALENPQELLQSDALNEDTVLNRRTIANLHVRWSREDTPAAMAHWMKVRDNYAFYADRYYDTHRAIAMRGAYRRLPGAPDWLDAIPARADDLELKEWRIRTALLAGDWARVMKNIDRLPAEEQEEDHWAYWEARALEVAGNQAQAAEIYRELATLQSYHGFLSADRLGQAYSIKDEPISIEDDALSMLADTEALQRAREYHAVDLQGESRREWNNWLLDPARTPQEMAQAAVLAARWELHDRAIFSAGRAEQRRAISLRFPVLYESEVAEAAEEHGIEPAWILGVMRRESAYIQDVQSPAGAVGLMQLMPRTAKYVAELQGDDDWNGDLTDAGTNIGLGTYYLRHVLDKFEEHQVLATASYNAGPHRVGAWLQDEVMEADRWIDTIPFTETRRYVRAVLAYTAIYEWHLTGEAQSILGKLKPIPPAPEA